MSEPINLEVKASRGVRLRNWGGVAQPCGTDARAIRAHGLAVYPSVEEEFFGGDRANEGAPLSPVAAAQQVRNLFRIKQLELSVEKLQKEVAQLSSALSSSKPSKASDSVLVDPNILAVVQVTEELFNGPIQIESQCDPSDDNSVMIVLTVSASRLSFDEIIDRQLAWHEKIALAESGYSGQLRLQVVPSE